MQERIVSRLKTINLGNAQIYKNIAIFPLTDGGGDTVSYMTLSEALESHVLTVTEVSQSGSVPELKVTNNADKPVLLLDGEELAGAKQNRVLNTTVLVPEKKTIIIPVSCTEAGRWSFATAEFYDSGMVMARCVRSRKSQSVSEGLKVSPDFRADQGEVWDGIACLQKAAAVLSPTAAMRDVFEAHRESLDEAIRAFPLVAGQVGILAVISGQAAGFDLVSSSAAYMHLHGKLLKSYLMDALIEKRPAAADPAAAIKAAQEFLGRAMGCEEQTFKSVGHGDDYRFKGDRIAGSALVYGDTVIHAAFFLTAQAHAADRMAGLNRRGRYRME
jgi:hypothetical protein